MSDKKWRLVPSEATAEMIAAAILAFHREADHLADEGWQEIWRAMLDAAPSNDEVLRYRNGIRKIQELLQEKEPRVGDASFICEALLA